MNLYVNEDVDCNWDEFMLRRTLVSIFYSHLEDMNKKRLMETVKTTFQISFGLAKIKMT